MRENKVDNRKEKQCHFSEKIGNTTYNVSLHFSETSKETMEDKIKKLLLMELAEQKL
ncbi:MAG: transposon-encoded TnpW family protein [Bacillota bacterium]